MDATLWAKKVLGRGAVKLLGRRHLARLARFLGNEARLDYPNDMAMNGELALQRRFVAAASRAVVLDVGANVGDWSASMLSLCAEAGRHVQLVAFEPSSFTASILRERLVGFPQAVVEQLAMSDAEGTLDLFIAGQAAGINSLHASALETKASETEPVAVTTLDRYCADHSVEKIDFVKIDTEGNDLFVLRGARKLLQERRIGIAQFEYNHRWIAARAFLRDVFDLVGPLGYCVGKVTPSGIESYGAWHPELESYREGNYVVLTAEWRSTLPQVHWWND